MHEKEASRSSMAIVLLDKHSGKRRVILENERGTNTKYGRISYEDAKKYLGREIPGKPLISLPLSLRESAYQPRKYRYATQIIYPEDRGSIITFADIRYGKRVLEAGTGSGFLASFLTRHASYVYTYEIREDHYKRALRNMSLLARPDAWEIRNEDVRSFKSLGEEVDAIVLDLPEPRVVIKEIYETLKPGGRLCVLVPTYNQIEATLRVLKELPFVDIFARENIVRDLSLKPGAIRPLHRGITFRIFMMFARRIHGEASSSGVEDDSLDQ